MLSYIKINKHKKTNTKQTRDNKQTNMQIFIRKKLNEKSFNHFLTTEQIESCHIDY